MHQQIYTQPFPCAPEVIWAFLTDLRNDKRWRKEVKSVELLEGTPGARGARYRETLTWNAGGGETILVVAETEPGVKVVIEDDDDRITTRSAWRFEPHSDGTLVTLNFAFEATGTLHLMDSMLWGLATSWLARDLPLLQGHVNCGGPSS